MSTICVVSHMCHKLSLSNSLFIMVSFAIMLCAIGLLVIPVCRLYAVWQAKKENNKFSDAEYVKHYMNIVRVVSLILCGIAMIVIFLIQRN